MHVDYDNKFFCGDCARRFPQKECEIDKISRNGKRTTRPVCPSCGGPVRQGRHDQSRVGKSYYKPTNVITS